jgi:hypothetical protein
VGLKLGVEGEEYGWVVDCPKRPPEQPFGWGQIAPEDVPLRSNKDIATAHRYTGEAAFTRADVADAHRRHPEGKLGEYAASRGLEVLGSKSAAGYFAAMPGEDDLQFNALRGELPGGEHGIVFHELLAWEVIGDRPAGNGTFWGVSYQGSKIFRKPDKFTLLQSVPILGDLVQRPADPDAREDAFGIPVTTAATLVPETTAAGDWSIDNEPRPAVAPGRTKLKEHGLPGWDLMGADDLPPAFVERLLAGPGLRSTLERESERRFFQVQVDCGTLVVRRNGWLHDDAALDALTGALSAVAPEVRAAGLEVADPRPFADPLPDADWPPEGVSASGRFPPDPWLVPLHAFASEHGLVIEDRRLYHAAFPTLPVPGRVIAVMRGQLPGTDLVGRLAWHAERDEATRNVGRNAVLVPAAPRAEETPPRGVKPGDGDLRLEVRDGVFAAWARRDVPGAGSQRGDLGPMVELVAQGVAAGREHKMI